MQIKEKIDTNTLLNIIFETVQMRIRGKESKQHSKS